MTGALGVQCECEPGSVRGPRELDMAWRGPRGGLGAWALPLVWTLLLGPLLGAGTGPANKMSKPYKADGQCLYRRVEYFNEEHGVCCSKCPPGEMVVQECTSEHDTLCGPCLPTKTYTELWHYADICLDCKSCDSVKGFEVESGCTPEQNTKCRCSRGKYCDPGRCRHCDNHSSCPPGWQIVKPGTSTSDTECETCPSGYYQDQYSLEARCKPHTDCAAQGLELAVPGTSTTDKVCIKPTTETPAAKVLTTESPTVNKNTTDTQWTIFTVAIIIVCVIAVILFIIFIIKTLNKKYPSIRQKITRWLDRLSEQFCQRGHQTQTTLQSKPCVGTPAVNQPLLSPAESTDSQPTIKSENTWEDHATRVECEHRQQEAEAPSWRTGGGPYVQETLPTAPSMTLPTAPSMTLPTAPSMSHPQAREAMTPQQIKMTPPEAGASTGTQISAGANHGLQIQGNTVIHNGNIYVYPHSIAMPPAPTECTTLPVQVTPDPNDKTTSMPDQLLPMPDLPPQLFFPASVDRPCVCPQQEQGKDMHLTTEEDMIRKV